MGSVTRIFPPLGGGGGSPAAPTNTAPTVYETTTITGLPGDGSSAVFLSTSAGTITEGGLLGFQIQQTSGATGTFTVTFFAGTRELARSTFTTAAVPSEQESATFPGYQSGVAFFSGATVTITGGAVTDEFTVTPYVGVIGATT